MIRKVMDRFGAGALAATGLVLLALSLTGMAGLGERLDAAARPSAPPTYQNVDDRDCPRERWQQRAPATEL